MLPSNLQGQLVPGTQLQSGVQSLNVQNSGQQLGNYQATAPISSFQNTAPPQNSVLGLNSTATASPATNNVAGSTNGVNVGAIGQLYDQQIGALQDYANNKIPQYQNLDNSIIGQGYDTQKTNLDAQNQLGIANLANSQDQLNTQSSNSLRDLQNNLRGMYNGYQNQLGVLGAGDSSAAPLLAYALQQQGNRETNDLNTQTAQQQTGINLAQQGLDTGYQGQLKSLDNWKNTNLQQIAENYAKQLDTLQQQISSLGLDKGRDAAMYGTQAAADQAMSQIKQLNDQYLGAADSIHNTFQQVQAPTADISNLTNGYNVQGFTQPQLQALNLSSNQVDPTQSNVPVSLTKRPDQTI